MATQARKTIGLNLDDWRELRPRGAYTLNSTAAARRRQELLDSLPSYDNTAEISDSLIRHLNATSPSAFSKLKRLAGDNTTQRLVTKLYPAEADYDRVAAILRSVQLQPQPIYGPSPKTPRIHARGRNVTGLPSPVRQDLTRRLRWVELDLAHAQLACNARRWGVDRVLQVLDLGAYSFWDDLMQHLGAAPQELRQNGKYSEFKSYLKPSVHGLSFGMGRDRIRRFGTENQQEPEGALVKMVEMACGVSFDEAGKRLLTHPVLEPMLNARYRQTARIKKRGGHRDVLGRYHVLNDGTNPASLLAIDAQAMEFVLLEPVIRLAANEREDARSKGRQPLFSLMFWQHDGFTVKARQRNRTRSLIRRLESVVNARAETLGVPTGLTVEIGPDDW
ncbi:MAG: hypothetical protein AAF791_01885 [Bacteroidota bacterium]